MSGKLSWEDGVNLVFKTAPDDSLDLRNSFLEGTMLDEWGDPIKQAEIHLHMQRALWEWEQRGFTKGFITAPPDSGKSQQLPVGLATYLQTRVPERQQLITSADEKQIKKRIRAIRMLVESPEYKYWCKDHNFSPLQYSHNDNHSSQQIYFENANRTGNPSFEGYSVLSKTVGQRAHILWPDDVCTNEDKNSQSHRRKVYDQMSNVWFKRVRKPRTIWGVRTKWHPNDANSRAIASGRFCHLEIVVNPEKDGYIVREYIPKYLDEED